MDKAKSIHIIFTVLVVFLKLIFYTALRGTENVIYGIKVLLQARLHLEVKTE